MIFSVALKLPNSLLAREIPSKIERIAGLIEVQFHSKRDTNKNHIKTLILVHILAMHITLCKLKDWYFIKGKPSLSHATSSHD